MTILTTKIPRTAKPLQTSNRSILFDFLIGCTETLFFKLLILWQDYYPDLHAGQHTKTDDLIDEKILLSLV